MVQSPAGKRERLITQVDRMTVGPHAISVMPAIIDQPHLALAGDVSGIVGQDVLAGLRYTIDYRNRRIGWDDLSEGAGAVAVLPLTFLDGLPVVDPAAIGRDADAGRRQWRGRPGAILIGTARSFPAMTADAAQVRLDSLHGNSLVRSVVIDELKIGPSTFKDMPAGLVKPEDSPAYRCDGLLPLHIFGRVTFDGPGRRLILG